MCDERGWKAGDLFMAIRVAITGRTATPPLFDTMVCLGYTRTLAAPGRGARCPRSGRGPDDPCQVSGASSGERTPTEEHP